MTSMTNWMLAALLLCVLLAAGCPQKDPSPQVDLEAAPGAFSAAEEAPSGTSAASGGEAAAGDLVTETFIAKGMHCDNCETAISMALGGLPGVEKVEADWKNLSVTVSYKPDTASHAQIAETIGKLGYTVEEPATDGANAAGAGSGESDSQSSSD